MKHIKYIVQCLIALITAMIFGYLGDGTKMEFILAYLLILNYLDMQDRPNA